MQQKTHKFENIQPKTHNPTAQETKTIKMNSLSLSIKREPLNILHNRERPHKRQKSGVAMDIVSVFFDIGAKNYKSGDYHAAEECFSQALCCINLEHLCSQGGIKKVAHNTTIKSTNYKITSCNGHGETSDYKKIEGSAPRNSSIEYDEGMRVHSSLLQMQDSAPVEEVAAILCYNVAQTQVQRGLYESAIAFFRQSLHKFTIMLNGVNQSLHIVMNLQSLGYCLYRTGSDDQANDCYQRALAIVSERNLGTAYLAASVNCIGILLFNQPQPCDNDIAMDTFRKSLELYKSCANADVTSFATVLNNIGRVHYVRSEFGKAIDVYEECLQIRRACLGNQSNDVAATAYNLGQTCYQLGLLDDSLSYYQEFLKIIVSAAGPSSKDIALVYKGIGDIYRDKVDYKVALHYFQKASEVQRACSKGIPSADVAATLNKMGNLCYEMKDFSSAMKHYQDGLKIEKEILPPHHPHIIITTTNIGHIHKQLGELQNALLSYTKVRHMQQMALGDDNFALAETMSSIGLMQYHLKNYEASFDSYQDALRLRRQHLGGDEHPEIASTLNSIGLVLFKQDIFQLANNCFTESLRIRSKLLGKDHRDVAILWYNIATITIHFETGEDELAIQMYKETLRIERNTLGDDHLDVVLTLQHLGQIHQQLGHTEKAIDYFQEALEIERRRKEPTRRSLARILNLLGNVYLQLGRTDEMMECYVESSRFYESSNRSLGEALAITSGYNFYGLSKTNPPCAPVA
jgi:tetratricopeptide (TPR) repeat protein